MCFNILAGFLDRKITDATYLLGTGYLAAKGEQSYLF